jgi:hypothetical protein
MFKTIKHRFSPWLKTASVFLQSLRNRYRSADVYSNTSLPLTILFPFTHCNGDIYPKLVQLLPVSFFNGPSIRDSGGP